MISRPGPRCWKCGGSIAIGAAFPPPRKPGDPCYHCIIVARKRTGKIEPAQEVDDVAPPEKQGIKSGVLGVLARVSWLSASEIAAELAVSDSESSSALRRLVHAGAVRTALHGRKRVYSLPSSGEGEPAEESPSNYVVIAAIRSQGAATIRDVARMARLEYEAVRSSLRRLISRGVVKACGEDRCIRGGNAPVLYTLTN